MWKVLRGGGQRKGMHQLTHLIVANSIDTVLGASKLSQRLQVWGSVGRVAVAGGIEGPEGKGRWAALPC